MTGRPATAQDAIHEVMRRAPITKTWTPIQMREALAEQGKEFTLEHVTTALSRLFERGRVVRFGRGIYALQGAPSPEKAPITFQESGTIGTTVCSRCHGLVSTRPTDQADHRKYHLEQDR